MQAKSEADQIWIWKKRVGGKGTDLSTGGMILKLLFRIFFKDNENKKIKAVMMLVISNM